MKSVFYDDANFELSSQKLFRFSSKCLLKRLSSVANQEVFYRV